MLSDKERIQHLCYCDRQADSRAVITASQDGRVLVFDVASPLEPPVTWLTYAESTNDVSLHPSLPLLAVAVGERKFPLPSACLDGHDDAQEAHTLDNIEDVGCNGLMVWNLPEWPRQTESSQSDLGSNATVQCATGTE